MSSSECRLKEINGQCQALNAAKRQMSCADGALGRAKLCGACQMAMTNDGGDDDCNGEGSADSDGNGDGDGDGDADNDSDGDGDRSGGSGAGIAMAIAMMMTGTILSSSRSR